MVEKMKTDVDRQLLVLTIQKIWLKLTFFYFVTKSSQRPFLFSLPFPKFLKQNFMYFGHKHVKTQNQ